MITIYLENPRAEEMAREILEWGDIASVSSMEVAAAIARIAIAGGLEVQFLRVNKKPHPPTIFTPEQVLIAVRNDIEIRPRS